MKAGFVSLGCSKNLVDTEVMLGLIKEREIELVNDPSDADILIVNTCAFIQSAKEESINTILNMAEYKQPEKGHCKSLIIAGCLGQRYGQELLDELPEADGIIGTEAWGRVTEVIDETLKGNRVVIKGDETIYDASVPRIPTTPKHTAYVKIAEGCNNRCAFCAIPLIRGKYRSRKLEDIVAEVRNLADKGVREIVLIAQDTTNYGHDIYGEPRLAQLLRELCKVEGIKWIRTLYNYPRFLNDELIEVMATEEKIVKYVDIPLQHASNEVLRRMRRPDTKEQITALLKKLRERVPGVVIRSTFIVGFPGETEEQFQELKDFIQEQRFDHAGFFTYSKEEDTPAANMDGQVDDDVMQDRYHEIKAVQSLISQEINESLVDQVLEVIVEGHTEDGTSYG
ncbi:MAG: 30S ribosomal protein S12 methylthiotransferase RimO, partial [Anaerovibrio sp.]|nr:30S ribosomal protein S12 methylthiotransferase RimO [Anaerovibrio sp.]